MAKTAVVPLSECTLTLDDDGPALEKRREQIAAAALRYGQNADKRLKVDRKVARQMLADASLAQRSGVKVRTFAHAAGRLANPFGNPPGSVTLGWTAATTFNRAVKHKQDDLVDMLVTAWNTETDTALKGKNGTIALIKATLAERGIGGRKQANRKRQSDAAWCVGQVRSLYNKVVEWSQGKGIKRDGVSLPGFNALAILDAMRRGDTVGESDYRATTTTDDVPSPSEVVGMVEVLRDMVQETDGATSPPVATPAAEQQAEQTKGRGKRRENKAA
jgi:hypothetical protein